MCKNPQLESEFITFLEDSSNLTENSPPNVDAFERMLSDEEKVEILHLISANSNQSRADVEEHIRAMLANNTQATVRILRIFIIFRYYF